MNSAIRDLADLVSADANLYTTNQRLLELDLPAKARIPEHTLLPWKLTGSEAINQKYRYELRCQSPIDNLELKRLMGQPVRISVLTDSGARRSICGYVAHTMNEGSDGGMTVYLLVIVDLFTVLEERTNNRSYQNISGKDAFLAIVREHQSRNPVIQASLKIDDRTTRQYPKQPFMMQFAESDAAFGQRRLFEDGVNYFFEHGDDGDPGMTLVLFDDNSQLTQSPDLKFQRADGTEETDSVTAWQPQRKLAPGAVASAFYNPQSVTIGRAEDRSRLDQGDAGNDLASTLEDYRYDINQYDPDPEAQQRSATLRMQAYEYAAKDTQGAGTFRGTPIGSRYRLVGHPEIDGHSPQDQEFVLTRLEIEAVNNLPADLTGNTAGDTTVFKNRFSTSRNTVRIVPEFRHTDHLKPYAPQFLAGTVVGTAEEEIQSNALCEVLVNLHFPRLQDHPEGGASRDDSDSVWIRVMQPWAGAGYGTVFIPRIGDEVTIGFLSGDGDKPFILGQFYNGTHRPPDFSGAGAFPGNKAISGIRTKMYKGAGANELLMDDSTHQQRARLASDHGNSALNLGFGVHPRHDGQATPRGEGAELRSDDSIAIRAAKALLLTTYARIKASGNQLDCQELWGELELFHGILKNLSELSATHQADVTDHLPQEQLIAHIKNWEAGSNTDPNGDKTKGGKPIVAISGQAGIAISTPQNTSITTGTNLDMVSVQDVSINTGRRCKVRAAQGISHFAHRGGIKLIAAVGDIDVQAHNGDIHLKGSGYLYLDGIKGIIQNGQMIQLNAQGAGVVYGNNAITTKTTGAHTAHAGKHSVTGPAAPILTLPNMPQSQLKTDERAVLYDPQSGEPVPNRRYRAKLHDQQIVEGVTDAQGRTDLLQSQTIGGVDITVFPDDAPTA